MKRIITIILVLLSAQTEKAWAAVTDFSVQDGTTITLQNIDEMNLLASKVDAGTTYAGYTFLLGCDLTYDAATENNFARIGTSDTKFFAGTFDGQGHVIRGVNLSGSGRQALFATVGGNAVIKNLTLSASTIENTTSSYAGGIVAYVAEGGAATIENCHVTNDVVIKGNGYIGGIVGRLMFGKSYIKGCTCGATLSAADKDACVGGIAGMIGNESKTAQNTLLATICDCLYYGNSITWTSSSQPTIGGIIGFYYTNIGTQGETIVSITANGNFYCTTDTGLKAIGTQKEKYKSTTHEYKNVDLPEDNGAVPARLVSEEADINDMGTPDKTTYPGGPVVYDHGISYAGAYYSHVLSLESDIDNSSLLARHKGQMFDVKLRRRILYKDGSWNTLCLPFSTSLTKSNLKSNVFVNAKEFEFKRLSKTAHELKDKETGRIDYFKTGCENGKLYIFLEKADDIIAGEPYLIRFTKADDYVETDPEHYDVYEPYFEDVTIEEISPETDAVTSTDGTISFVPTVSPIVWDNKNRSILFIGIANTLFYPSGAGPTRVGALRGYFRLNNGLEVAEYGNGETDDDDYYVPGGGDVKAFVINVEDNATDNIDELQVNTQSSSQSEAAKPSATVNGQCFDLSGREMVNGKWSMVNGKLPRGLYIIGKKKILVK